MDHSGLHILQRQKKGRTSGRSQVRTAVPVPVTLKERIGFFDYPQWFNGVRSFEPCCQVQSEGLGLTKKLQTIQKCLCDIIDMLLLMGGFQF